MNRLTAGVTAAASLVRTSTRTGVAPGEGEHVVEVKYTNFIAGQNSVDKITLHAELLTVGSDTAAASEMCDNLSHEGVVMLTGPAPRARRLYGALSQIKRLTVTITEVKSSGLGRFAGSTGRFAGSLARGMVSKANSLGQSATQSAASLGGGLLEAGGAIMKLHVPASTPRRIPRMSERYGMDGFKASMTSYKTTKFHVVEDPVLALIFRGLQVSIVIYAGIKLFHEHSYLKIHTPSGSANVYSQMFSDSDIDLGKYGFRENFTAKPPPYCCKNFDCKYSATETVPGKGYNCFKGHSMEFNGCRSYGYGEVVRKKKNGIFVTTYATNNMFQKEDPYGNSGINTTQVKYTRNFYVPGIEHMLVAALVSYDVLEAEPALLDQKENGNAEEFAPVEVWSGTGPTDIHSKKLTTLPAGSNGKIALPLWQWLEFASGQKNLLDQFNDHAAKSCKPTRPDSPYYRTTGYFVNVNLHVTNIPHHSFSTKKIPMVSKMYVSQGANKGWMSFVPGVSYVRSWPLPLPTGYPDGSYAVSSGAMADAYTYGVYVNFEISGEYGEFDFGSMISQFVKYIVILSIAPLITDSVMQYLMGAKSSIYKDSKNELMDQDHMRTVADERKEEEKEAIKTLFTHYDANGNGKLEYDEVKEVLKKMGVRPEATDEMNSIIAEIDEDGGGDIDLQEFTNWWLMMMDKDQSKFKKLSAFRRAHWKEIEQMMKHAMKNPIA